MCKNTRSPLAGFKVLTFGTGFLTNGAGHGEKSGNYLILRDNKLSMDHPAPTQEEIEKKERKEGKKELGYERIRLALERLQLAWLRTAITFVALGFTAYRYYLSRVEDGLEPLGGIFNGRNIGMFLLLMAFVGLVQSIVQHRRSCARLRAYYPALPYSVAQLQSYFVLALTFVLLMVVWFRLT